MANGTEVVATAYADEVNVARHLGPALLVQFVVLLYLWWNACRPEEVPVLGGLWRWSLERHLWGLSYNNGSAPA